MSALRQAKCGYLVWIPKMRNHQLFLRERQEAIFAHIQGNWKSSKAMKVFICGQAAISAHRPKLLTQCALCTQSDEGRSWSILQVLQNTDQSFKICKSGSICKFATSTRASTIRNSPSLKTLLSPNSSRCTFFTILCGSRDSGRLALYKAQLLKYHVLEFTHSHLWQVRWFSRLSISQEAQQKSEIWKSNQCLIWGLLLCSSFLVACTQLLWATEGTTAAEPCLHCPGPSHEDGTNTRLCFVFIFLLYKVKVKTLRSLGHKKFQLYFMEKFLKDNIKLWHFSFSEWMC